MTNGRMKGMGFSHRLQRMWPLVHVHQKQSSGLAVHPESNSEKTGTRLELRFMKKGSYNGLPASLIVLEMSHGETRKWTSSAADIRLDPIPSKSAEDARTPHLLYVGAFGPAHIVERVDRVADGGVDRRPATVSVSRTDRGVLVFVKRSLPNWYGLPDRLHIAFIIVHTRDIRIWAFPSDGGLRRFMVFFRTQVWPLRVTRDRGSLSSRVTCGRPDGTCHPSCTDFGADHMTLDVWKGLLSDLAVADFDGDPPNNSWVEHVEKPIYVPARTA